MKRSRFMAWVATGTSLLAATWPGIECAVTRSGCVYDAQLAVLTATLLAVIWYTYYTFESLEHSRSRDAAERTRARTTLASGLLAELLWLEDMLDQIYVDGPFTGYDMFGHPMCEAAIARADLFEPATLPPLTRFVSLLNDVRNGVNEFRVNPAPILGADPLKHAANKKRFRYFMQAKAGYALQALPPLVEALIKEGGVVSKRDIEEPITDGTLPKLPKSPFGMRRLTNNP